MSDSSSPASSAAEPEVSATPEVPENKDAAWHTQPDGRMRWWDGEQWTAQYHDPSAAKQPKAKRKVPLTALVVSSIGALILGVLIGAGESTTARSELELAQGLVADAKEEEADARQDARDAQEQAAQMESDLEAREAAVAAREAAVGQVEDQIAANTFAGDGMYIVNVDIQPGTYRSEGGSPCYWARLNAAGDDILDNNLGDGQTIVTVQASDGLLEVSGCADFVKVD